MKLKNTKFNIELIIFEVIVADACVHLINVCPIFTLSRPGLESTNSCEVLQLFFFLGLLLRASELVTILRLVFNASDPFHITQYNFISHVLLCDCLFIRLSHCIPTLIKLLLRCDEITPLFGEFNSFLHLY